jgi:hypothetical protein
MNNILFGVMVALFAGVVGLGLVCVYEEAKQMIRQRGKDREHSKQHQQV